MPEGRKPILPGWRFRLKAVPTLCCLAAFAVFLLLGRWQLRRLGESEQMQAAFAAGLEAPVRDGCVAEAGLSGALDGRRVVVEGTLRWERYFLIAGKYMWGNLGYRLLVPMLCAGTGQERLVDLGWLPVSMLDQVLREQQAIPAPRRLEGIARVPMKAKQPGSFQVEDGYQRRWAAAEPEAMGAILGMRLPEWVMIEGPGLKGKDPILDREPPVGGWLAEPVVIPHLHYAITWFSMAALVTVLGLTLCFERVATDGQEW
jgi:cytochrome oxidase assembly protein ShyY1